MKVPSNIFKSYDIRGLYPEELNEENFPTIVSAIYSFFQKKLGKEQVTIAIGRDMRISSPKLFDIALKTLVDLGANVIDLGLISTPTFYFGVFKNKYDCGFQISASHNPKDYNGVKIVINTPSGLLKIGKSTGMDEIKETVLKDLAPASFVKGSIAKNQHVQEDEVKEALRISNNPVIKKFKIVADTANAMGALYIEELFKHIPTELIKMNFELDGTFPAHQPDPLQSETLVNLQKKVVEEQADLGLAPDGDGDRLFFIDEKGRIVPPSFITALVARELLKEQPGEAILFDIRNILTPQAIVAEEKGTSVITKVGHAFITEAMHKTGALFAGESSGHYFFRSAGGAESQVPIILLVLKILTEKNKPLSEVIEEIRRSYESGETNFKVKDSNRILSFLKNQYRTGELNEMDGIAISYSDWRFSVRSSNTEPLLRLNVEAKGKETMEKKREELIRLISSLS